MGCTASSCSGDSLHLGTLLRVQGSLIPIRTTTTLEPPSQERREASAYLLTQAADSFNSRDRREPRAVLVHFAGDAEDDVWVCQVVPLRAPSVGCGDGYCTRGVNLWCSKASYCDVVAGVRRPQRRWLGPVRTSEAELRRMCRANRFNRRPRAAAARQPAACLLDLCERLGVAGSLASLLS
ncbi:uncharacterized protein LOC126364907 [Schistocerca gregaria]|uniref:uncharacterized protein LOC126364907 n=1 Tax=Schistocerca gregaria TaxID=7010 RepID=UPI00211E2178|nr:uncharacterized protein LOC126364907 [Schistocerca gregaria]